MIQFVDQDSASGFTHVTTMEECVPIMEKRAREFFADNPDFTNYSVALIDFDTREHTILEFDIETKITISEY